MKLVITNQVHSMTEVQVYRQTIVLAPFDTGPASVQKSIFEALGDLVVGTGAGTYTRLASPPTDNGKYLKRDTTVDEGFSWVDIGAAISAPFLIQIPGGNLLTPASTGFCDTGENVTTEINDQIIKVNKFEKGEVGQAELPFIPDIWNEGTVTAQIRMIAFDLNELDDCDGAWTYLTNVTGSNDTTVKVEGTGSVKMAVNATFTTGIVAHKTISSVNLTSAQYIYIWFRSSVALDAGDWQLCLDDTAAIASPIKTYDLPAIAANTWTQIEWPAGDMSGCTSIISIGLKQAVDKGALDAYIDLAGWTGNVTWGIQAATIDDGESADVAWGTAQEYTDPIRYYKETVVEFPTLTIGGTPETADKLRVQIYRKDNVSDTHGAAKASFAGAKLIMTKG